MSDYKRYTKRDDAGIAVPACRDCELYGECGFTYRCCYERVKDRLAELEDKIENGTLVELPCKVGDVLYYVKKYEPTPRIEENKVHTIEIYECRDGLTIRIWTQNGIFYADKMPNVFLTKAEAEAELEKIRREKQ